MTRLRQRIGPLILVVVPLFPASAPAPARSVTCALSNPSYSGWCRVTEGVPAGSSGGSVCKGILACLNDVRCTKIYCNATQIRGGWKLEKVRNEWKRKP